MLPRKSSWGLAAVVAAWLAAPSPIVRAGTFALSPAGGRARAGEVLPLSWRLDGSESASHDEMELVLSLDDGATFPIRVVARLGPTDSGIDWRVPALPTPHARLALRAGEGGAAETEEIVAVSDAFAIATAPFESLERLYAVAGEWRTRDALEGAPARTQGGLDAEERSPEVASRAHEKSEPETSPTPDFTPASADHGLVAAPAPPDRKTRAPRFAPRVPRPLRL